jgi:hypothetical protein
MSPAMKPTTASILCVVVLLPVGWLCAREPGTVSPGPAKGRVLLLENERALQGEVDRIGDQYRIRRGSGETWASANKVLRVCASLEEAYQFLRARANLNDPDERLRLANWCRRYDLPRLALPEAEAALQMRPNHPATKGLVNSLRDAVRKGATPGKALPTAEAPVPPVELTSDALGQFATKVQPILMNTCACCHVAGRGGKFQLTRAYEINLTNKRTMHQNLTAVLSQVDPRQPGASPLLTKALSIHARGMSNAPLRGRQAAPYRALEDWVNLTVANNPQLRTGPPASAPEALPAPPRPAANRNQPPTPASFATSSAPPRPAPPASTDPVDPDVFNRQFHPERAGRQQAPPPKP